MIARTQAPLILFDGVCNLCNAWVRFVVRRDPAGIFRFAAQQSPIGQAMIEENLSGASQLSSVILIEDNLLYAESDAVLQILARLSPPCGLRCYGSFLVQRAMPATASSSAIDTSGSDELKPARFHQGTSGRDSSNSPRGTRCRVS